MATRFVLLSVSIIAAVIASSMLTAQFHGEDEVGVYITANWLVESAVNGQWLKFGQILIGSYHPPGRFLMAMISFLIFGPSIVALRLPAIVLWAVTCALAADSVRRLTSSPWAGLLTGLLLALSGLFSLEALGFGHGVLTMWVMLFIWFKIRSPWWDLHSPRARRHYVIGGLILALGFLWFTSLLPINGLYHLYYFYRAARDKNVERFRQFFLLTLPFIFFYATYYLVFLGLPQYAVVHGLRDRPVGQLHQNLSRSASATLNLQSFVENIRTLNWYHVPFASWILLGIGLEGQWRYARHLLALLLPYAVIFSFYLVDNTGQHFVSYYVWVLPFAVATLWQWGKKRGRDWQGVVACLLFALCICTAVFGYVTSVRRYTEETYPYELAPAVFASGKWRVNLIRPLPQIAADLSALLEADDRWTATIDGALPLYYFPDSRYVPPEEIYCQNLRIYVRARSQPPLCDTSTQSVISYPQSWLELVILP